jgi:hypothetical protein
MHNVNTAPWPCFVLFLLALFRLRLGFRSLLPHTDKSRLTPRLPQLLVHTTFDTLWYLALLDLFQTVLQSKSRINWQHRRQTLYAMLVRALELILAAVELLVLARATWEEDQTLAVRLEACDVECEGFLGQVLPAMIKGDTNGGGEFAGNAGLL